MEVEGYNFKWEGESTNRHDFGKFVDIIHKGFVKGCAYENPNSYLDHVLFGCLKRPSFFLEKRSNLSFLTHRKIGPSLT